MRTPLTSLEQLVPFATAGELVAKKPGGLVSIEPGATAFAAMQKMADKDVGLLVVLENDRLVGVLSERDCARRLVLDTRPAKETPVRSLMTARVYTVTPQARIPECITLMHEKGIHHLPVVDAGRVTGVLSVRDLMGALIERHERLLRRLQEERLTLLYPDPSSY
jgi:signal-transduction protein with cAMP-binding, CBS, and nucleotidyltransferase domain